MPLDPEITMKHLILGAVLAGASFVHDASAMSIGVGLQWREVFVQEYWVDGSPHYAIANFGKTDLKISMYPYRAAHGAKAIAGPWEVKAGSVTQVEAPGGLKGLVALKLADGKHLGLLGPPKGPATQPKGKYISYDGLNGSGGRHLNLWCEQDALTFKSGGVIELKLAIPAGAGLIKYKKDPGNASSKLPIKKVAIREAVSETARITSDDKLITIDTKNPVKQAKAHSIIVRFDAPKVTTATMAYADGWLQSSGRGGHGITRGVIVVP